MPDPHIFMCASHFLAEYGFFKLALVIGMVIVVHFIEVSKAETVV